MRVRLLEDYTPSLTRVGSFSHSTMDLLRSLDSKYHSLLQQFLEPISRPSVNTVEHLIQTLSHSNDIVVIKPYNVKIVCIDSKQFFLKEITYFARRLIQNHPLVLVPFHKDGQNLVQIFVQTNSLPVFVNPIAEQVLTRNKTFEGLKGFEKISLVASPVGLPISSLRASEMRLSMVEQFLPDKDPKCIASRVTPLFSCQISDLPNFLKFKPLSEDKDTFLSDLNTVSLCSLKYDLLAINQQLSRPCPSTYLPFNQALYHIFLNKSRLSPVSFFDEKDLALTNSDRQIKAIFDSYPVTFMKEWERLEQSKALR